MSGGRSSRDSGLDIIKAFAIVLVPLEHAHAPFFAKNRPLWEHVVGNAASAVTPIFLFASGVLHSRAVAAARRDWKRSRTATEAPALAVDGKDDHDETKSSAVALLEEGAGTEGSGDARGSAAPHDAEEEAAYVQSVTASYRQKTLVRLLIPYLVVACTLGLTEAPNSTRRRSLAERCLRVLLFKARGPYYYINIAVFTAILLPSIARMSNRSPIALLASTVIARLACVCAFPGEPFVTPLLLPRYICFYVIGWEYAARWSNSDDAPPIVPGRANSSRQPRNILAGCVACTLALPFVLFRKQFESATLVAQVIVDTIRSIGFMAACILVLEVNAGASAALPLAIGLLSEMSYTIYLYHLYFIEAYGSLVGESATSGEQSGVKRMLVAGLCFGLLGGLNVGIGARVVFGKRNALRVFGAKMPAIT